MDTIEENPCPNGSDESRNVDFGVFENVLEIPVQETHREVGVEKSSPDGFGTKVLEERQNKELDLGSATAIEEEVRKVSLIGDSEVSDIVDGDRIGVDSGISNHFPELKLKENESGLKEMSLITYPEKSEGITVERDAKGGDVVSDGEDSISSTSSSSDSESESNSSSSSASSSSSSSSEEEEEEEEKEEEEEGTKEMDEVEEGEIMDFKTEEMVFENDEDEDDIPKGPIKSKNEVEVLPPVPPVDVTLEPHHQILPVGAILSIVGAKVIVEGVEKHNPLNEGSILWITETRTPLGLVDEIFGPVKNPYYIVRYNSDQEVPSGIHEGTPISFVSEFANHILDDQNLYKKGYDASGDNDEEVSDEAEFSDDEKEAEYRRTQRMAKKGANNRKRGKEFVDRKKFQHKGGAWKNMGAIGQQPPNIPNQLHTPPVRTPSVPPQHLVPLNGVWPNGMPCQPQQHMVFPNGLPMSGIPFQQQMLNSFPNRMPIEQHFDPTSQSFLPYGQSSFSQGPSISWPGLMGPAGFNPVQFGTGFQGQHMHTSMNEGEPSGSFVEQSHEILQPSMVHGNLSSHQQFNQGATSSRGGRPYRRGGGRFSGGRGRW